MRRVLPIAGRILALLGAALLSLHVASAFAAGGGGLEFLPERPSLQVASGSALSLSSDSLAPGETRLQSVELVYRGPRPARSVGVFAARGIDSAPSRTSLCRSDLSDRLQLEVSTPSGALLFNGSIADFSRDHWDRSTSLRLNGPIAPGASSHVLLAVRLDPEAGNSYMGCRATLDLAWHLIT